MLAAPSPKKATATWSVPRTFAESAGADRVRHAHADDRVDAEHADAERR